MKIVAGCIALVLMFGVALRPCVGQDAKALIEAGLAKTEKEDYPGAIQDFTKALELDPTLVDAWKGRGNARLLSDDYDGAIADYSRGLELNPAFAMLYNNRSNARTKKGDYQGAIADSNRALELDPKFGYAYINRAYPRNFLGDAKGSLADFLKGMEVDPTHRDYPNLWVWILRSQSGAKDEAAAGLKKYCAERTGGKPDDWFSKLAGCLLGDVTEEALLKAAEAGEARAVPTQQCEALFYASMKALTRGDTAKAMGLLERCVATKRTGEMEYHGALLEMKTLGTGK